ncbi:tRNA lysidine(34) synthetase TilS [Acetobacter sp.]|uniref:tRNA lysidine(34) synthetase TilS n=1 Tax=Acetobacter sp. TaxID=440 RepID=UPI0039E9AE2B
MTAGSSRTPFSQTESVSPRAFARIMEHLGPWLPDTPDVPPVALAVSGGGDSLALALLAAGWRKNLVALVVDHGLRPEFRQEAALAAQILGQLGIPVHQLRVASLPYGPRLAERARKARYAVLNEACRRLGAVDLLVAHQADDQVETVAMREIRRAGPGLAGMAATVELADVRLVRPLLGYSRETLRQTLRQAGLRWCDDPSNENEAAERVRVRKKLQIAEKERLWRLALDAAQQRSEQERRIAEELSESGCRLFCGAALLGEKLPSPTTLAALIRCIGALDYLPSMEAVGELCRNGSSATLAGVSLSRAKVGADRNEQWLLVREAAAMEENIPASLETVWDRRFRMQGVKTLPDGLFIGAAGNGIDRKLRAGLPTVFTKTLPAFWRNGQRVSVPHLGICEDKTLEGVGFAFVPPNPVTTTARWMNIYLT